MLVNKLSFKRRLSSRSFSGPITGQKSSGVSAHWVPRREAGLRSPATDGWRTPSWARTPVGCRWTGTAGQPSRPSGPLSSPPASAQAWWTKSIGWFLYHSLDWRKIRRSEKHFALFGVQTAKLRKPYCFSNSNSNNYYWFHFLPYKYLGRKETPGPQAPNLLGRFRLMRGTEQIVIAATCLLGCYN